MIDSIFFKQRVTECRRTSGEKKEGKKRSLYKQNFHICSFSSKEKVYESKILFLLFCKQIARATF